MNALRNRLGQGPRARDSGARSSAWIWWAAGSMVLSLVLGLAQVWCNIERLDLAYGLTSSRAELAEKLALAAKLEVERDNLLSPHRLRAKAEELRLAPVESGRIRRMEEPES